MSENFMVALCGRTMRDARPISNTVYSPDQVGEARRAILAHAYGLPLYAVPYDTDGIEMPSIGRDPVAFPEAWRYARMAADADKRIKTSPDRIREMFFRHENSRIEGYWRIAGYSEGDHLPEPQANAAPWHGKSDFLVALAVVERAAIGSKWGTGLGKMGYMGFSNCRICGCRNGATEFYDPRPNGAHGWRWPEGFRHYVEAHNVEPSTAFLNYVIWRSRNLR